MPVAFQSERKEIGGIEGDVQPFVVPSGRQAVVRRAVEYCGCIYRFVAVAVECREIETADVVISLHLERHIGLVRFIIPRLDEELASTRALSERALSKSPSHALTP